ncbi:Polyphosphate kinase 2 (PPK2) [Planctomycetes bacterium Pla163]|uniref:ADP/GDP-polyphosphate phosphotransferase n=1 Tax=Rohdeia mirabilis TaxID=2528008 RepID=A0A518CXI5_9BACT|nr:Polyphosphate kinase 2 (PPK2) [Planctomycetes bacterium Pla163]
MTPPNVETRSQRAGDDDHHSSHASVDTSDKAAYKRRLRDLQVQLVRFQRHAIDAGLKILVVLEGRDSAGKDGTIKRFTEHLSPRETRVVALGKPTDRDRTSWYFQRWVPHLPAGEEIVLFNRSWYNRAGVERVMGFCTEQEVSSFFKVVVPFERMLVDSGIQLFKYYLDIGRDEQEERLDERREDPLKQWKISPIDAVAVEHYDDYTAARDEMFVNTHRELTPWTVVRANDKRAARLGVIADLLHRVEAPGVDLDLGGLAPDRNVVFPYETSALTDGRLER